MKTGDILYLVMNHKLLLARIVERYKHDNNIHGMVWPAQSPDINVIENCWLRIKRTLQYRAGGFTNSGQFTAVVRHHS